MAEGSLVAFKNDFSDARDCVGCICCKDVVEVDGIESAAEGGEGTPVDMDFAPTAEEQAALPAVSEDPAAGPGVITRDGKCYLVDPATGQEVEVAPVEGEKKKIPTPAQTEKKNNTINCCKSLCYYNTFCR